MTKLEAIRERYEPLVRDIEDLYADDSEMGNVMSLTCLGHDLLALCEEYDRELREAVTLITALVDVVDAHDIDSLSCDRDGRETCDCLSREVGRLQAFLARYKENT